MSGLDAIDGARVPGWPYVYVIGSYDARITFFSQQVRSYNLVGALVADNILRDMKRFAVIGAGAAGLSASAALSLLLPSSRVDVFEREEQTLHLQRGCTKRNLHPHIYEWPLSGGLENWANLPFLDWEADESGSVATKIGKKFEAFAAWRKDALKLRLLTEVTGISSVGSAWQVTFIAGPDKKPGSANYDAVFLSIGFGRESHLELAHAHSYWSDQGVPGPLRYSKDGELILVSGSGDGGLIDLCAALIKDFDHEGLIVLITGWSGIASVFEELIAIDAEAVRVGTGFDFVAAYDRNIGGQLRRAGLVEELAKHLRQRVSVVFNTLELQRLQQPTSTLNRLAAYLLFAAASDAGMPIKHISGELRAVTGSPGDYEIAGTVLRPDEIVVRHGSDKIAAFAPFENLRAAYELYHGQWLDADPQRRSPPQLEAATNRALQNALDELDYPVERRQYDAAAEHQPRKVRIAHIGPPPQTVVSGVAELTELLEWWGHSDRELRLDLAAAPAELKNLACAAARFAIHAVQARFHSKDNRWNEWLTDLTQRSPHARAVQKPLVGPALSGQMEYVSVDANVSATELHQAMDVMMLKWVNDHLSDFLRLGSERANWVGWEIDRALRHEMAKRWQVWFDLLRNDAKLLSRLLRLAACTVEDDIGDVSDRQVLVGPHKVSNIVRSITLALAAADVWRVSAPCHEVPGNFDMRNDQGKQMATIHASGAELIERQSLAMMASRHKWRTTFVLLSELAASAEFEQVSQRPLTETTVDAPRLDASPIQSSVIIGAGEGLQRALRLGREAVSDHFSLASKQMQQHWVAQIEEAKE